VSVVAPANPALMTSCGSSLAHEARDALVRDTFAHPGMDDADDMIVQSPGDARVSAFAVLQQPDEI
jgi:hypothetical protein